MEKREERKKEKVEVSEGEMEETQEGIHQDILFQDVPTRRVPLS
jgi:hypothetical protein